MRLLGPLACALLLGACALGAEAPLDGGPISGETDLGARDIPRGFELPSDDIVDASEMDLVTPDDLPDATDAADAVDLPDVRDVPACMGECDPGSSRACGNCGRQTCTSSCTWGTCTGSGVCAAGTSRACGNCGRQTCTSSCTWGGCGAEGSCAPGQTRGDGCDPCSQQVCNGSCQWGGCQLRPGAACEFRGGRNNRGCSRCRCGLQWCLNSCQWSTDCTSCCTSCGGCL